jgi:hypothetical protein
LISESLERVNHFERSGRDEIRWNDGTIRRHHSAVIEKPAPRPLPFMAWDRASLPASLGNDARASQRAWSLPGLAVGRHNATDATVHRWNTPRHGVRRRHADSEESEQGDRRSPDGRPDSQIGTGK